MNPPEAEHPPGAATDTPARSPWRVVALIAAAAIATVTMTIGLASGGLDGGTEVAGQWIYCAGPAPAADAPTIWLEPNVGEAGLVWEPVYLELAQSRRVCTRDRPGLGRSAPRAQGNPTAAVLAEELGTLLGQSDIDGPLVLVGHGAGALTLRHFAAAHPTRVGLQLEIDPPPPELAFHEDRAAFIAELPSSIRREFEALPLSLEDCPPPAPDAQTIEAATLQDDPQVLVRKILDR
jgi:pimeloyl-ACP methyl ester carboxylesterase